MAVTQGSVKSLVATQGNVTAAFSHQIQKVRDFPHGGVTWKNYLVEAERAVNPTAAIV